MRIFLLFIRVNEEHVFDVLNYVSNKRCFIVKEIATNTHFHGLVEVHAKSYEAAKKSFQRSLTLKCNKRGGDGSHSCERVGDTDEDLHKIFRYCCKADYQGDHPDVYYNTWTLESRHIRLFHYQYWDVNVVLSQSKPTKGTKSSSEPSYIKGVIKFIEEHKPGMTQKGGWKKYNLVESKRLTIIKLYVLGWYVKVVKTFPNATQLGNMANTVYAQILSKNYPDSDNHCDRYLRIASKFAHELDIDFVTTEKFIKTL